MIWWLGRVVIAGTVMYLVATEHHPRSSLAPVPEPTATAERRFFSSQAGRRGCAERLPGRRGLDDADWERLDVGTCLALGFGSQP